MCLSVCVFVCFCVCVLFFFRETPSLRRSNHPGRTWPLRDGPDSYERWRFAAAETHAFGVAHRQRRPIGARDRRNVSK